MPPLLLFDVLGGLGCADDPGWVLGSTGNVKNGRPGGIIHYAGIPDRFAGNELFGTICPTRIRCGENAL